MANEPLHDRLVLKTNLESPKYWLGDRYREKDSELPIADAENYSDILYSLLEVCS